MFMRRLSALGYRHSAKTNTNDKSEHEGHKGKKQGHETKGKQTTFPILRVRSCFCFSQREKRHKNVGWPNADSRSPKAGQASARRVYCSSVINTLAGSISFEKLIVT